MPCESSRGKSSRRTPPYPVTSPFSSGDRVVDAKPAFGDSWSRSGPEVEGRCPCAASLSPVRRARKRVEQAIEALPLSWTVRSGTRQRAREAGRNVGPPARSRMSHPRPRLNEKPFSSVQPRTGAPVGTSIKTATIVEDDRWDCFEPGTRPRARHPGVAARTTGVWWQWLLQFTSMHVLCMHDERAGSRCAGRGS